MQQGRIRLGPNLFRILVPLTAAPAIHAAAAPAAFAAAR
jgi:hypothetical protein